MEDLRKAFECAGNRLQIEEAGKQALLSSEGPEMLYMLTNDPDRQVAWRALWACEKLCRKQTGLFSSKKKEIMQKAMQTTHQGMKRLWISMLFHLPIQQPLQTDFLDFCLQAMYSPQETPAVQALCIKLAYKMCLAEPELLPKLEAVLENMEEVFYPVATRSARKNTLKAIKLYHRKQKKNQTNF